MTTPRVRRISLYRGRDVSADEWRGTRSVKCEPKKRTWKRPDWRRLCYYVAGELAMCVCRKRWKQTSFSCPYHKVLAASLTTTTSRPRSLASRNRWRCRGCWEDTGRFAPRVKQVTRNIVATFLCDFYIGNALMGGDLDRCDCDHVFFCWSINDIIIVIYREPKEAEIIVKKWQRTAIRVSIPNIRQF